MTTVNVGDYITGTGTLHVTDCPTCGCVYAIPDGVYRMGQKYKTQRTIYCPNGHEWHYTGKTHAEELRELREQTARATAERDQAEADARAARAREGKATKSAQRLRARAAAGVCPHCNRTFKQLAAHMKTKHPEALSHAHADH